MKVRDLRNLLDRLVEQGHGDLDVVMMEHQWTKGACGHEAVCAPQIQPAQPYSDADVLTQKVVVINNWAAEPNF